MNTLERMLQDDLNRLVDRLAAVAPDGPERRATVQARLDGAEARLSSLRQELLQGYAKWREALEECGDLWAISALGADQVSELDLRAA
jgi:hypothetical protein